MAGVELAPSGHLSGSAPMYKNVPRARVYVGVVCHRLSRNDGDQNHKQGIRFVKMIKGGRTTDLGVGLEKVCKL